MKIINNKLDIKLGQFTQEELNISLTKIKNRKAIGLNEIPPEVWKTRNFDDFIIISSCRAISTDILDPLLPPLPIVHRFQ